MYVIYVKITCMIIVAWSYPVGIALYSSNPGLFELTVDFIPIATTLLGAVMLKTSSGLLQTPRDDSSSQT